jgi:ABC-type multidrug transport system fused ATPase/permease subunit
MFRSPSPDTYARLKKGQRDLLPKVKPTRQSMLRLLGFARPYWWQLGLLMGMAFVSSTLNLTYPALMGTIIDSVVTKLWSLRRAESLRRASMRSFWHEKVPIIACICVSSRYR